MTNIAAAVGQGAATKVVYRWMEFFVDQEDTETNAKSIEAEVKKFKKKYKGITLKPYIPSQVWKHAQSWCTKHGLNLDTA